MNDSQLKEQLLFEEEVHLTEIKEYGFSWQNFANGNQPIPPEGLRFDIHFEGKVIGEKINGTIKGIDYLTVRPDKRLFLNLQASIETGDGASISVTESGINDNGNLRLNMNFHTNDDSYKWINYKHVWGIGKVNFQTGKVFIKGYQN